MLIFQAIILGLIQGITEFIPVSSSAHLIIIPWLFKWTDTSLTSLPFDVALHLGTLLALLIFFALDWVRLIKAGFASIVERKIGTDPDRKLAWLIVIGTIPGGIAGILGESKIADLFHQPNQPIQPMAMIVMGLLIAGLALLLFLAEKLSKHTRQLKQINLKDTILIGLSQALAIFPGISRSGSTITAGLALGLEREAAARFSFLLSAPIIAGAGLKSLYEFYKGFQSGAITGSDVILFPIGFVTAAISGYFCIRFLMNYLQKNTTNIFIYYRWALAILIILVALTR
jgi:undecaprenyl-diphosphatase